MAFSERYHSKSASGILSDMEIFRCAQRGLAEPITRPSEARFAAHFEVRYSWEASERRKLMLAGAFANPTDGVVLFFRADSPAVAEKLGKTNP